MYVEVTELGKSMLYVRVIVCAAASSQDSCAILVFVLIFFRYLLNVLLMLSNVVRAPVAAVCCRNLVNLFQLFKPFNDVLVFVCLC